MSEWKFFTDEEMYKWVGPRCPDVEPGCVVCKAWTRRDLLRQWEYEDELDRRQFLNWDEQETFYSQKKINDGLDDAK